MGKLLLLGERQQTGEPPPPTAKQRASLNREARIDFDLADDGISTLKAEASDGGGDCKAARQSEAGMSHRVSLAIRQKTIRETTVVSF